MAHSGREPRPVTRRTFLLAGLAASAAGLATGPWRAVLATSPPEPFLRAALRDPGVVHGPAVFPSGDSLMRAHVARPAASGRHPVMLVNHGNTGIPEDVLACLAHLAQRGFAAITFDTDTRSGGPPGQMVHAIDHYRSGAFADQLLADNAAALEYMRALPFTDASKGIRMLGFCGGGWSVLRQATRTRDIRAVVALYAAPVFPPERTNLANPRPNLIDFIDDVRAPMQLHYGDRDTLIPVPLVHELEDRLRRNQADAEVHHYQDAGHAFCAFVDPAYYNESAARLAYQSIDRFLAEH